MVGGIEGAETIGRSGLPELVSDASELSRSRARDLAERVQRRKGIPLRTAYIRSSDMSEDPPLARLIRSGGRGGATAVKLHLGLVWLAASPPFEVKGVSSRVWAELLDLDDPASNGKRRINQALVKLEQERLIRVERIRGGASTVRLLVESGVGLPYVDVPSTARFRAAPADRHDHAYFQVPRALWLNGHIQSMSAKALAMLLVITEEQFGDHEREVWWSEQRFRDLFGLSRATRSEGARELFQRRLVVLSRRPVSAGRSAFAEERMRNTYVAINDAVDFNT